jgi:hypothetical protein
VWNNLRRFFTVTPWEPQISHRPWYVVQAWWNRWEGGSPSIFIENRNPASNSRSLLREICRLVRNFFFILSRDRVIINGFWIGNWIYWTLTDPWLQVTVTVSHSYTLQRSLYVCGPRTATFNDLLCYKDHCNSVCYVFTSRCLTFLPSGDCLTTNSLLQRSCL